MSKAGFKAREYAVESGIPHTLVVVTFPEIIFSLDEFPLCVRSFQEEVANTYFAGTLPRNFQRSENTPSRRLRDVYLQFVHDGMDFLIMPGTLLWKHMPTFQRSESSTVYNTAPVFYNGNCVFLWDKQLTSDMDGKAAKIGHRRLETVRAHMGKGFIDTCTVSELTQSLMNFNPDFPAPIFTIQFDHKPIVFGISICRDYMRSEFMIGKWAVDVHVLMANGMEAPFSSPERIMARHVFLYCDIRGNLSTDGYTGSSAMYRYNDFALWQDRQDISLAYKYERQRQVKDFMFVSKPVTFDLDSY